MSKPWYKSRTVWIGVLVIAVGFLQVLADSELFEAEAGWIVMLLGVVKVIMRFLTDRPIRVNTQYVSGGSRG